LYIENEEFVDRAVLIRAAAQDASPSPKFAVLMRSPSIRKYAPPAISGHSDKNHFHACV
jgi:hypothetical protein